MSCPAAWPAWLWSDPAARRLFAMGVDDPDHVAAVCESAAIQEYDGNCRRIVAEAHASGGALMPQAESS